MYQHSSFYRFLSLLVAAGLLLSACAGAANTNQPSVTGSAAPTEPDDKPQASAQPSDAEPTEVSAGEEEDEHPIITFAASEWERSMYEPLIEQFNQEHPEMTVQFAPMPDYYGEDDEGIFQDYYRLYATTGDTFIVGSMTGVPTHYLRDIQPLLEADPSAELDDFLPGALETCQDLEGRQLGVPLWLNVNGIFYDEEAFDAAGLPSPQAGWTWDEFRNAITTLAKTDGDNIQYGLVEQYSSLLNPIIEAAIEDSEGKVDAETLLPLIQWYVDLVKAKAIYPPMYYEEGQDADWEKRWQELQDMFTGENRPPIWPGSLTEVLPSAENAGPAEYTEPDEDDPLSGLALKEYSFAPYPIAADNPNDKTTPLWTQCAAVSSGSKNPRAAWTWLNFLSRQRLVRDSYGPWEKLQLPARTSVADAADYWALLPDGMQETINYIVEHGWAGTSYYEEAYSVENAVSKFIAGKADLATALTEAENERLAITTPSPTPNMAPITVATPKPTLSADMVAVKYYNQAWGPDREALDKLLEEYNKANPGIFIEMRSEFNPAEKEDYLLGLSEEFDCFTWYPSYSSAEEDEERGLLNLDSLVEAEGPEFIQDFDAGLLSTYRKDGSLYGLPANSQPQIMTYNADLLEKRGVEPPAPGWSFDDFIAASTKVASANEADLSYAMLLSEWDSFLFDGSGVQWADFNSDPPVVLFDSTDFVDTLNWLNGLNQDGIFLLQTDDNWEETESAIRDGQIAFWMSQAGQPEGWYFYEEEPPFKIGVTTIPILENEENSYMYSGSDQGHFISAKSQNTQACWNWIKFLSEQPSAFPGVPARKSVQNSPEWEALVGAEYAEIYRQAATLNKPFDLEDYETSYNPISWPVDTWKREIISALFKGEDYTKVIPKAQQKAEDYLACMASVDQENLDDTALQEEINRCALQADPDNDQFQLQPSGGGGGGVGG